jgi:hypothetical protein
MNGRTAGNEQSELRHGSFGRQSPTEVFNAINKT